MPPKPYRHRAAMQMATTLSALLNLPTVWPNLKNVSASLNPSSPDRLDRLAALSAQHPELAPHILHEMTRRARRFITGVTLYRDHPAARGLESAPVIWQAGTTVLRDYTRQAAASAPTILAIPSLINRFTILDLHPNHSFLRLLAACGFRVLVVDWGVPDADAQRFDLSAYITERLIPILGVASERRPAHVLGYCMGGLLALGLAHMCPDRVRSLSLLATPWDFQAGFETLGQSGPDLEEKLQPWLSGDVAVPVDVIQSLFAALQPMQALTKFSALVDKDQSSFDVIRFVLTEDWLNDGVALAAPAARDCFGGFCARNSAALGQWKVGGRVVDPSRMTMPTYAVVPGRDRIVPPESAMPLARAIPHAISHEPMLGHIGIMASPKAPHQVWTPLAQWLATH
jgi:polyhydroxyalkanoate synthase